MRANQFIVVAAALLAMLGAIVNPATAQTLPDLQIRVYDVGDFVMEVRDYEYPGSDQGPALGQTAPGYGGAGMGGMGGGMFAVPAEAGQTPMGGGVGGMPAAAAPISMEGLTRVILNVVAPDTWSEAGGHGRLDSFGSSLIIAQTSENHAQIEQLLAQLRKNLGEHRTVKIDARWLPLNSEMLGQLVSDSGDGAAVNREALEQFSRQPGSIRMRTSCFSGQLVYVVSGTKRSIVSGYMPVVGSVDDGADLRGLVSTTHSGPFRFVANQTSSAVNQGANVGYHAQVEKLNIGTLLEIRPTLVRDTNTAVVDLRATVTGSEKSNGEAAISVRPGPPEVDRVAIQTEELATTLRVPLGEPVLVGGMTVAPAEQAGDTEQLQLYMILEVR
ncbi:MAG: hypothetical protein WDZ59_07715 [Pirellulales bacterium]